MKKQLSNLSEILDLDKNVLTLADVEFIAKNELCDAEYISKYNKKVYSNIFLRLTHKNFDEVEALFYWKKVILHRQELQKVLNRDPGIIVACLDYFTNINQLLEEVTIIEESRMRYIISSNLIDDLTKLFSRGIFDIVLLKEVNYAKRLESDLSLIMMDVDDFKIINSDYGHQTGDHILKELGMVLLRTVRSMDIACRYGGDEFAIIMPNTSKAYAFELSERIKDHISTIKVKEKGINVSIGISTLNDMDQDGISLIKRADENMFLAKQIGKNCIIHD